MFIEDSALKYLFLNVQLSSQGSTLKAAFLDKLVGAAIRNTDRKRLKIATFFERATYRS